MKTSIDEKHLREFIRTWSVLPKRAKLGRGWTCYIAPGLKATPFALQWRSKAGKREIRAIRTCGNTYTLSADNVEHAAPWRDMRHSDCWPVLYADLAEIMETTESTRA